MKPSRSFVEELRSSLPASTQTHLDNAIRAIVRAKRKGGRVVVVTGSGPNVHEGVTTLIAELMRAGIVDGVTTSSAVVSHELGGVLDRVKRVDGTLLGLLQKLLPRGNTFELTLLDKIV